ncbi:MAG: S49 family peptidase [Myxococcaceae bacterium]
MSSLLVIVISFAVFMSIKTDQNPSRDLCNIAVLPIVGDIIAYAGADGIPVEEKKPVSTNPDDLLAALHLAEKNPHMMGVLVRIDSSGGTLVASEIIANGLKRSSLPVVSMIRENGLSAAYLVATGAKTIIASPFSEVGSIGINMSYLEKTKKNEQEGLKFIELNSGKFKNYLNNNRNLTSEERNLIERDLKINHQYLVKLIAENRNLPIEQVEKLADGSFMPGSLALENKLIDQLGDIETARAWFAKHLKIKPEEIIFCGL